MFSFSANALQSWGGRRLALTKKLTVFESTRRKLGMTIAVLAKKSGVSPATVNRILSGMPHAASFANVTVVAEALGLNLQWETKIDAQKMRELQARAKAKQLIKMLQGTSGLEGQAFDSEAFEEMEKQTMHELLAGSSRKLWGE
jgi:transcriptional regulator with XRE-family HTH domain